MEYQSSFQKILKYFIVFAVMYLAVMYIPSTTISFEQTIIIAMLAAILFAFLDIYFPSIIIEKK